MRRLELDESKALCMSHKMLRYADAFQEQLEKFEGIAQKREAALGLVESIKALFVKYYQYLDDDQKKKVFELSFKKFQNI